MHNKSLTLYVHNKSLSLYVHNKMHKKKHNCINVYNNNDNFKYEIPDLVNQSAKYIILQKLTYIHLR